MTKAMVMKLWIGLCGSTKADFANQLDFHGKDIVALKSQRFIKKPKNMLKCHKCTSTLEPEMSI